MKPHLTRALLVRMLVRMLAPAGAHAAGRRRRAAGPAGPDAQFNDHSLSEWAFT